MMKKNMVRMSYISPTLFDSGVLILSIGEHIRTGCVFCYY